MRKDLTYETLIRRSLTGHMRYPWVASGRNRSGVPKEQQTSRAYGRVCRPMLVNVCPERVVTSKPPSSVSARQVWSAHLRLCHDSELSRHSSHQAASCTP